MPSFPRRTSPRPNSVDTFWARWSPTTRHAVCVAILLVIGLAYYSPVIFGGQNVTGVDNLNWRASANVLLEYQEQTGERALWNPNVFGGMPGFLIDYGPYVPQIDDLLQEARSFAWPVSHLFFLMVGCYLLLFYLTRNHWAGLLAGVAFGFTTYIPIIIGVGHNIKFIALAFAPYVILTFIYALRKPSLLAGLLFALALALDLRARHPQITYNLLMMLLAWWIVELVMAWRAEELPSFAKATGWLALGTGLAIAMVAQPYFAIYQYKQYSVRGGEAIVEAASGGGGSGTAMAWDKAMQWSHGPKELITFVIAEAFGGGGRTYWGPKPFTEGPNYVGGVVTALAGLALWRVRSRVTWGLGVGLVVTVLFSFGRHATWWNWPFFRYFPFFDSFRAPEMWLSVTALGLAILAGLGLDYCLREEEDALGDGMTKHRAILYAFGGVAGFVLLLLVGRGVVFDFESPRETQIIQKIDQNPRLSRSNPRVRQFLQRIDRRKEQRQEAFRADALRTLLAVGLALLLLWLYRRDTIPGWVAAGLVVTIVLVDLWGVDRRYLGEEDWVQGSTESQIPTAQVDRFIKKQIEKAGGEGHFRVLPLQPPYQNVGSPTNNAYSSYHYQQVGGYQAAKLQRYQHYLDHILQINSGGGPNENAVDLLNARYVIAKKKLPGTKVVYKDQQGFMVLENPDAVPRGFFVGQTEVVDGPRATWKRLRDPTFDPRTTAVLPEPLDAPITPIDSASTTRVELASYSAPEIRWTVETDAPRLFVASEVYYPAGWNAYLDGEQVPIHRVNYLLRAVHVPAGEHTLVMRFEPKVDRYSTWVSVASTVGVYGGLIGLVAVRLRRRWTDAAPEDEQDEE